MGLSALKNAPKTSRPAVAEIDLAPLGLEGSLTFRAPSVPDFFPSVERRNQVRLMVPSLAVADPTLETQLLLLILCHVPDAGETDDPVSVFCGLMQVNREAFLGLGARFGQKFPLSMGQAKQDAGNASGQ